MSTEQSRLYDFVTDAAAAVPITASRVDAEFDQVITALNLKVLIKSSAPASPIAGMLWLDSTNKVLKQYRNSEWVVMGCVHVGTSAPTTKQEGDIWWDSTNDKLYVYTSTTVSQLVLTSQAVGSLGDVLIGQGSGTAPTWLVPGSANLPLVSRGALSNPAYGTISKSAASALIGSWATCGYNTVYTADTDTMICMRVTRNAGAGGGAGWIAGLTDTANPPTTVRTSAGFEDSGDPNSSITDNGSSFVCRKGENWKVTTSGAPTGVYVYSIPIGV